MHMPNVSVISLMSKSSIPFIGLLLANIATSDPKHHIMLALIARLAIPYT